MSNISAHTGITYQPKPTYRALCHPAFGGDNLTVYGEDYQITDTYSRVVNLTYFRKGGKYYSEGSFEVPASMELFQVWDAVLDLRTKGRLPGLVNGARDYQILVNVPGHPHEHPRLVML